jgi:hypothetical protein
MMTTKLNKRVSRVSGEVVRDGSKFRQLVVTLYPSGDIGLRPQGTRREERFPLEGVYHLAVKARVAAQRAEKLKAKKKGKRS